MKVEIFVDTNILRIKNLVNFNEKYNITLLDAEECFNQVEELLSFMKNIKKDKDYQFEICTVDIIIEELTKQIFDEYEKYIKFADNNSLNIKKMTYGDIKNKLLDKYKVFKVYPNCVTKETFNDTIKSAIHNIPPFEKFKGKSGDKGFKDYVFYSSLKKSKADRIIIISEDKIFEKIKDGKIECFNSVKDLEKNYKFLKYGDIHQDDRSYIIYSYICKQKVFENIKNDKIGEYILNISYDKFSNRKKDENNELTELIYLDDMGEFSVYDLNARQFINQNLTKEEVELEYGEIDNEGIYYWDKEK